MKIEFEFRSTKMGGVTRSVIWKYPLEDATSLEPYRQERSRTGNHGTDYYEVPEGKYIVETIYISNSGKHHCILRELVIKDGKEEWKDIEVDTERELAKRFNLFCDCHLW